MEEKGIGKVLEKGESTFMNGSGSMCGGVISKSMFNSDPWAYMMAYYMEDDRFEEYKNLKAINQPWADKEATKFFKKFTRSAI